MFKGKSLKITGIEIDGVRISSTSEMLRYMLKQKARISELKKENTELKETLKTYNGCGDWDNDFHTCRVYLQHEELQKYIEQLNKAKEIIREYMNWADWKGSNCPSFASICIKAEKFISEVEK